MLEPIKDLEFHPDPLHRYRYKGKWLAHSVTGVVSDLSPFAKAKIDATKDQWLPRGQTVHAALEGFLLGLPAPSGGDYDSIIQPLLSYPLWEGCEVVAVEYRLCDREWAQITRRLL